MSSTTGDASSGAAWIPQARRDVLYRELVDGGLVYDSSSKQVHHLNETAALVWEACQRGSRVSDIVRELCDSYAVAEQTAWEDVKSTLQRFETGGLLANPCSPDPAEPAGSAEASARS